MPPLQLLALKAPAPAFDASKGAEGLPKRFLVFPWGTQHTAAGEVVCNDTTVKTLAAFNAGKNWDRPALDFEHSSVPGSATYKGEPVKVAGYGTLEVVKGEGIYMLMSSWTDEGREYAAGGHYGDLSPTVKVNAKNEIIGLHSVALCRHGATPGVLFLFTAGGVQDQSTRETRALPTANSTKSMTPEELMKALAKALGLAETATAEEILAAMTEKLAAGEKQHSEARGHRRPISEV